MKKGFYTTMQLSASTKFSYALVLVVFLAVACGPKTTRYVPPAGTDSDEYYEPPIPVDNDDDWYYNYHNLEY